VTAGKDRLTTVNRTVTTWRGRVRLGETGDQGCRGLAGQNTSSVRETFKLRFGPLCIKSPTGPPRERGWWWAIQPTGYRNDSGTNTDYEIEQWQPWCV